MIISNLSMMVDEAKTTKERGKSWTEMKKKGEKKSEKRHTEDMFKAATTAVVPKSLMALSSMALCAVKNVLLMNESVQVISNQKC